MIDVVDNEIFFHVEDLCDSHIALSSSFFFYVYLVRTYWNV